MTTTENLDYESARTVPPVSSGPCDRGSTNVPPAAARSPLTNGETNHAVDRNADSSAKIGIVSTPDIGSQSTFTANPAFVPFPLHALPRKVGNFVEACAASIGCDPSLIAVPLLTACASVIGNCLRLRLKRGWDVPPTIWACVVCESGSNKSTGARLALKPLKFRQEKDLVSYQQAEKAYQAALSLYEEDLSKWKKSKKGTEPVEPRRPTAERNLVGDTTLEAIVPILRENKRGVLLSADELQGWLSSFDRYAKGKGGGDEAHWLSMHSGESILVDRKTGEPRTLSVPVPSVSIFGGIQPAVLSRSLGSQHRESGLAARFLFCSPPARPKTWSDSEISREREEDVQQLYDRLFSLVVKTDQNGTPVPEILELSPDGKVVWKNFYNEHNAELAVLTGHLRATWAKLEEYVARLALVLHCVHWASSGKNVPLPNCIEAISVEAAIEIVSWFKNEALRLDARNTESEEQRERRELIEWISRQGGNVTARKLQNGNRRYPTAKEAEAALCSLVKEGLGEWENSKRGEPGRPTRQLILLQQSESAVDS